MPGISRRADGVNARPVGVPSHLAGVNSHGIRMRSQIEALVLLDWFSTRNDRWSDEGGDDKIAAERVFVQFCACGSSRFWRIFPRGHPHRSTRLSLFVCAIPCGAELPDQSAWYWTLFWEQPSVHSRCASDKQGCFFFRGARKAGWATLFRRLARIETEGLVSEAGHGDRASLLRSTQARTSSPGELEVLVRVNSAC